LSSNVQRRGGRGEELPPNEERKERRSEPLYFVRRGREGPFPFLLGKKRDGGAI